MAKQMIVARSTSTMSIDHQKALRGILAEQLGDEYTLLVVPPHVDVHLLQEGQAVHASVPDIRVIEVPRRMGFIESLCSLFTTRKPKETTNV